MKRNRPDLTFEVDVLKADIGRLATAKLKPLGVGVRVKSQVEFDLTRQQEDIGIKLEVDLKELLEYVWQQLVELPSWKALDAKAEVGRVYLAAEPRMFAVTNDPLLLLRNQ